MFSEFIFIEINYKITARMYDCGINYATSLSPISCVHLTNSVLEILYWYIVSIITAKLKSWITLLYRAFFRIDRGVQTLSISAHYKWRQCAFFEFYKNDLKWPKMTENNFILRWFSTYKLDLTESQISLIHYFHRIWRKKRFKR